MSSTDLKIQLKRKDEEIEQLRSRLAEKDDELEKLRVLVDQYKSVLEPSSGATGPRQRGVGISAEPQAKNIEQRPLQVHNKSERLATVRDCHCFCYSPVCKTIRNHLKEKCSSKLFAVQTNFFDLS